MPTVSAFVPRRTTHLIPGPESSGIDAIPKAVVDKECLHGVQPRFGGKCYDLTWTCPEAASNAATSGLSLGGRHFELRLLGQKSIDVSRFVPVEFPDKFIHELLTTYGTIKPTIRHLHLKEPGLKHVENGVRVVTFTEMTRSIPHTMVYQNTPLRFRNTGQPTLCFKCASPEHVVRDCPKKKPRSRRPWRQKLWEPLRIARPRPWRLTPPSRQIWPCLPNQDQIWNTWPPARCPDLSVSVSALQKSPRRPLPLTRLTKHARALLSAHE